MSRRCSFCSPYLFMLPLLWAACTQEYQPKPKGYNRLILPLTEYRISPDSLPYQFEYSKHARLLRDSSLIRERHWVEIYYPELKANIHITYKRIGHNDRLLKEFMDDAYHLTAKHQIKAYAIEEMISKTPSGKTAVIAEIDVAVGPRGHAGEIDLGLAAHAGTGAAAR